MNAAKALESVATMWQWFTDRLKKSSARFPLLRRKRRVIALWLLTAYSAHIVLLALFLILHFSFPHLRDSVVDWMIPESVSGKLVGIFGGESSTDQRRQIASQLMTLLAWIGGGSLVALMFWIQIPSAITRSALIAREQEAEADALLDSTPTKSVMLYRSALALACDTVYEEKLRQKLVRIDKQLSNATEDVDPSASRSDARSVVARRFTIIDELGRGAYGVVYRAMDDVLGREVALKELPVQLSNDKYMAQRFRQEARALAKLNHPNIVQVYDFIEYHKRMWMAIELVKGGDLASYLARRRYLAAPEACRLGTKIAEAVAFAHDRGVIHRDLKPLNVLLVDENTPKVADFGLAKLAEGGVDTLKGTIMGSPHYMSPEQAEGGSISHSSDIYSLGVIIFEMLTGGLPFEGEIASILAQHIRKPPPRLRDAAPDNNIPQKLEKLVLTMLAKKAENRPTEMKEIITTLASLTKRYASV